GAEAVTNMTDMFRGAGWQGTRSARELKAVAKSARAQNKLVRPPAKSPDTVPTFMFDSLDLRSCPTHWRLLIPGYLIPGFLSSARCRENTQPAAIMRMHK